MYKTIYEHASTPQELLRHSSFYAHARSPQLLLKHSSFHLTIYAHASTPQELLRHSSFLLLESHLQFPLHVPLTCWRSLPYCTSKAFRHFRFVGPKASPRNNRGVPAINTIGWPEQVNWRKDWRRSNKRGEKVRRSLNAAGCQHSNCRGVAGSLKCPPTTAVGYL